MGSTSLDDLKKRRQWLVWRYEERGGKQTKVPYSPTTARKTGSDETHRGEWATFDEVANTCEAGGYSGVGLVLTDGLNGIDIDHRGLDDAVTQDVLLKVCSYAERSPSGEGLHILFSIDPERLPADFAATYKEQYYSKNTSFELECYLPSIGGGARYFTFTGVTISDQPINDCTEGVLDFLDTYMRKPVPSTRTQILPLPARATTSLADDEVIAKAQAASNGDKFTRLWQGDTSGHNNDDSAADLALCSHLAFWCGGDTEQMDRLFRQSDLMRDKWDEIHDGVRTYGQMTIEKAVSSKATFYASRLKDAIKTYILEADNIFSEGNDLSDVAYSNLFSEVFREKARYSMAIGWLVWSGKVWQPDKLQAQELLKDLTKAVLDDACQAIKQAYGCLSDADINADDNAKRAATAALKLAQSYKKFAIKMRTASKINGVLTLAASSLAIKTEECDKDPFILNTPSGMVDLTNGDIRPHDPLAFCTKITNCAPAQTAANKQWEDFLQLITQGDKELITYLQVVAGAAAIGRTYIETVVIAHGSGANGKSTFFNALFTILGSYAGKIPAEALTARNRSVKVELAELLGKRLIIASETEEGQRLSNSMLKQVASTDPISAERKYKDPFSFMPSHLLILYTNFLPRVSSSDHGTWRRLAVAPFNATITKPQTNFLEKLLEQSGEAILRWVVDGAQIFIQNEYKLPECEAVKKAVQQYAADNDWLTQFLDECCTQGEAYRIKASELYTAYNTWAKITTGYARSITDFKTALEDRGFDQYREKNGTYWLELSLSTVGGGVMRC